jgi:hypothetical protein
MRGNKTFNGADYFAVSSDRAGFATVAPKISQILLLEPAQLLITNS